MTTKMVGVKILVNLRRVDSPSLSEDDLIQAIVEDIEGLDLWVDESNYEIVSAAYSD